MAKYYFARQLGWLLIMLRGSGGELKQKKSDDWLFMVFSRLGRNTLNHEIGLYLNGYEEGWRRD